MADVNFAVFGLGDSSYERYAYAGKLLHRRMLALGANALMEPSYSDERAPDGLEQSFLPWLKEVVSTISPYLEPIPNFVEIQETALPEPIYRIEWEEDVPSDQVEALKLSNGEMSGRSETEKIPPRAIDRESRVDDAWKPKDCKWARLRVNKRFTKPDWWQDVREIELEWENGDSYVSF